MAFFRAWSLVLPYLIYSVHSVDQSLHTAKVDVDLRDTSLGQSSFPEDWQRELMALTALSRLQEAKLLSLEPLDGGSGWSQFRENGIYEALLNMVRITDFQMFNQSWPNSWSMWGLEKSFDNFPQKTQYGLYRSASSDYPFGWKSGMWPGRLKQSSSALVMAAKWAVDLKNQVKFYNKPFYSISETVEALLKLRDPTCYFKGNQAEGERLLRLKLVDSYPPSCRRQMHIAIALDPYGYSSTDIRTIADLFDDIRRYSPYARITIRGTSRLPRGFPEGALLDRFPQLAGKPDDQYFETLDLIADSIKDLIAADNNIRLRAKVLLFVSKFKREGADYTRAQNLRDNMKAYSIEPFYFTVETEGIRYEDGHLMYLLNSETFRGITSGSNDDNTNQMILHRMLRLICQSVISLPKASGWRTFTTYRAFDKTKKIYNRIHLQYDSPFDASQSRYTVFRCLSTPDCQFSVYAHPSRILNEYFYDKSANADIAYTERRQWNLFDNSGNQSKMNLLVVPKTTSAIAVIVHELAG